MHNARRVMTTGIMVCLILSSLGIPTLAKASGNSAPVITSLVSTSTLTAGALFSYQLTATDADADTLQFHLGRTVEGMTISPSGLVQWTPKFAGSYAVEFRAHDSFGNMTAQPVSFTVVHAALKTISLVPAAMAITAGESKTWSVTASDVYLNTWDVTSAANFSTTPQAGGSWSGATYTSQNAGSWTVSATVDSLTVTAPLTVSQSIPVKLDISPSTTTITADEQLPVTTQLSDKQGNSWDSTGFTTLTTDEPTGKIDKAVYIPTKKGNWKLTATIDSKTAQASVTVNPGSPAFINITPNTSSISLAINQSKAFMCTVTDAEGNIISDSNIQWGALGSIGIVDPVGVFTALKAGKGSVTAKVNDLVTDVAVTVQPTTIAQVAVASSKPQGQVKGEQVDKEVAAAPTTPITAATTNDPSSSACATPSLLAALLLYAAFIILLTGYYFLTRKEMDLSWWIFPLLLTVIGIIVWNKYFCGAYRWWPWILALLGLGLSAYLRNRQPSEQIGPPLEKPPVTF